MHNKHRFKAPTETGGKEIKYLTFGEMVQNMMNWFMLAAKSRGQALILYQSPDAAGDPSRAKQLANLNEQIKKNPNTPLPSGFTLAQERIQIKEYKLPNEARVVLGPAKCAALTILEDILAKNLDVHIFEPKVRLVEVPVVKL